MKLLHRFAKNERGATAIEYGLIACLIGVCIISGMVSFSSSFNGMLSGLQKTLTSSK